MRPAYITRIYDIASTVRVFPDDVEKTDFRYTSDRS